MRIEELETRCSHKEYECECDADDYYEADKETVEILVEHFHTDVPTV